MPLILLVLALAYIIWRVRTPAYQQRTTERKAAQIISQNTTQATNSLRRFTRRIPLLNRGHLRGSQSENQLRTWINANWLNTQADLSDDTRALAAWINTLNEKEYSVFVGRLRDYAGSLGVSLDNLFQPTALPELKTAVEEAVRLSALAVWKSDDIRALVTYQEWSQAPDKFADKAFIDRLYANVVKAGLADANIDALMQTNPQRQAHIVAAIRKAADEHHTAFINVLRQTASEPRPEAATHITVRPDTVRVDAVNAVAGIEPVV